MKQAEDGKAASVLTLSCEKQNNIEVHY